MHPAPHGGGFAVAVRRRVEHPPLRRSRGGRGRCRGRAPASPEQGDDLLAMSEAAHTASAAVVGLERSAVGGDPPSCTFLCARYVPAHGLTVGWLGDCRRYAASSLRGPPLDEGPQLGDRSGRRGTVDPGRSGPRRPQSRHHPLARGRCLGPDPDVVHLEPVAEPTWLVFCSDGVWNYLTSPEQLTEPATGDADAAPELR